MLFRGMTASLKNPFRGLREDSLNKPAANFLSHNSLAIINEVSVKGTAFLILFWALAEVALLLGNSAADRSAQVAIQYTPPIIEVAEYPQEPNLAHLMNVRVLASKAAP
jgi:hypothetical protein